MITNEDRVRETIELFGAPPASIATAIVVGDATMAAVVRAALPSLRDVLVVAPDRLDEIEVLTWLVARGAVTSTPWFVEPSLPNERSIVAALDGLVWCGAATALDVHRLDVQALQVWSDRFAAASLLLPALRCAHALHERAPSPALARRVGMLWAQLGVPARARAWLLRSDLPGAALQAVGADLDALAAEIAAESATVWGENLVHLRREWPAVASVLEATPPGSADVVWIAEVPWRLQVAAGRAVARRDAVPLLVDEHDGRLEISALPEHPRHLARALLATAPLQLRHACVGSLLDYAGLVNVLGNPLRSQVPGWRQSVYLVEPDAAALRRLLEAIDVRALTSRERVQSLEVGTHAIAETAAAFAAAPRLPLPRIRVACTRALDDALAAVHDRRMRNGKAALDRVMARDDLSIPQRTLDKLRDGRPLRIWAWTSIHTTVLQHVADGLAAGMRALGHEVELLVEKDPREQIDPAQIAVSLAEADPDLAFLVDHVRPEFAAILPRTLPVAAWILDELPMLSEPRVVAGLDRFDFAFAWSRFLTDNFLERGYPHCTPLLFAVDAARYDVPPSGPAEDVVAYATHLAFPREPPDTPGLFRALEQRMTALPEVPSGMDAIVPLLRTTLDELGLTVPAARFDQLAYDSLIVSRHVDRVRIADRILDAGLPIALYGNGWSEIPRFAPHARGPVAPGHALRDMYQRHKVVLHINTRCNLHLRVLEASAAGGFILARSDGDWDHGPHGVSQHLEVGRELCVFTDGEDLVAKIRRAFTDEAWRRGFADAARARVLRDHTYVERAKVMLAEVGRRLGEVLGGAADVKSGAA